MAKEVMWVGVAVNDDNGETRTGIRAAHFDDYMHIAFDGWEGRATGFKPIVGTNKVRIGRRLFVIEGYRSWFGNMSWEGIKVTITTAQAIAEYLRSTGKYQIESGAVGAFEAWEANEPIVFEDGD